MSAPINHLSVIDRFPALRSRSGRFRQAIRGLSETASASCLARVCARRFHSVFAMLGAARRGGESKDKAQQRQHQKQSSNLTGVIPAQAGIQFWRHAPQPPLTLALSPRGRGD